MHEMSIAKNIIDIIHTAMPDVGRTHVERVAVEIGEMSAVAIPSLEFCFQAATEGGPLQDARLDVRIVPIRMECHFCGFEFNVENHDFRQHH